MCMQLLPRLLLCVLVVSSITYIMYQCAIESWLYYPFDMYTIFYFNIVLYHYTIFFRNAIRSDRWVYTIKGHRLLSSYIIQLSTYKTQ